MVPDGMNAGNHSSSVSGIIERLRNESGSWTFLMLQYESTILNQCMKLHLDTTLEASDTAHFYSAKCLSP